MKDSWIINLLKHIYRRLFSFVLLIKWKNQTCYLRKRLKPNEKQTCDLRGTVLLLAPHSDDEWIGCSQLICDKSVNVVICNMDMSGGDTPELHERRREEMENVAAIYSRKLLTLKGDKQNSLINIIESFKPNFVCLPFIVDWHDEHREVMKLLSQSYEHISAKDLSVIMYQVSVPIPPTYINYVKKISNSEWEKKWKSFKVYYPTQTYIPYKRFALNERVNGGLVEEYAAEVYSVMSISHWSACFQKSFQRIEEIKGLIKSLPDMINIRGRAEVLCNMIFNI